MRIKAWQSPWSELQCKRTAVHYCKIKSIFGSFFSCGLTIPWRKKKCTNPVHSRDFAVHSFFERYFRILKIWGKSQDICPFHAILAFFTPPPQTWGGRGRTFKSCHSDQVNGGCKSSVYLYLQGFSALSGAEFFYIVLRKNAPKTAKNRVYI